MKPNIIVANFSKWNVGTDHTYQGYDYHCTHFYILGSRWIYFILHVWRVESTFAYYRRMRTDTTYKKNFAHSATSGMGVK